MKVIYYTRPCFLDLALSYASELSKQVELHLVVEIAPEDWQSSLFDLCDQKLRDGVINAIPFFKNAYPEIYYSYLNECASINIVIHNQPKSVHPATLKVCFQAMNLCLKIAPKIIHFDEISLRTAWGIWRLKKIPIIVSIHDPVAHDGKKDWRKYLSRKISFPFVDSFLLHSKSMKKVFLRKYKFRNHLKVIHNYLAPYNIFRHWIDVPIKTNGKTVLFFGRLSPYKGINILLKAAPIIAKDIPHVRIIIAGRPISGFIFPLLPDLPNNGKFEIYETYINNSKLAILFQQATVVTCPYIEATQSGVLLTAYGFTKPVVSTKVGGLSEYVWEDKTGLLVSPGDHRELAKAIIIILNKPEIQRKYKKNIEQIKQSVFNWETISKNAVLMYSELIYELEKDKSTF